MNYIVTAYLPDGTRRTWEIAFGAYTRVEKCLAQNLVIFNPLLPNGDWGSDVQLVGCAVIIEPKEGRP